MAQSEICAALNMLTPAGVKGHGKVRVGGLSDGGYVMIDRLAPTGGSAYSLGVGPDTSWDVDMAERGWDVYQYDHTVEGAPDAHERCRFHKIGLAATDQADMKRLDTLMTTNGHEGRSGHVLKADIEGHEWAVLGAMPRCFFAAFDQIVMEIHWLNNLHDRAFRNLFTRVIGNIALTHQCVHIHGNNHADLAIASGLAIPPVIEVTFANRAVFEFEANTQTCPGLLDTPNNSAKPDLYLGLFSFPWRPEIY